MTKVPSILIFRSVFGNLKYCEVYVRILPSEIKKMMRKLPLILVAGLVAACSPPPATMQIKRSPSSEPLVLIGTYSGGIQPKAMLEVTDGRLSCVGEDAAARTTLGFSVNRTSANIKITCNDGRTGLVQLQTTTNGIDFSQGVGVGSLSDGSRVRVIVGEIGGMLDW